MGINPGNSGGPLLNSNGQVIGMNSMGMTASGSSAGVGFAIPISAISKIADILIGKGRLIRPNFGVTFDMGVQRSLGISRGVLVSVAAGGAKQAGMIGTAMALDGSIQLGDIVLSINGIDVNSDRGLF